jgi:hypothetical protein
MVQNAYYGKFVITHLRAVTKFSSYYFLEAQD